MNMQSHWSQHYKAVRKRIEASGARDLLHIASPVLEEEEPPAAPTDEPAVPQYIPEIQALPPSPLFAKSSLAKKIVSETAIKHDVKPEEILGERRASHIVKARQEVMYRLKHEISTWSFPRIGRFMGRDHTTILNGVRRHEQRLETEKRHALMQAAE